MGQRPKTGWAISSFSQVDATFKDCGSQEIALPGGKSRSLQGLKRTEENFMLEILNSSWKTVIKK